MKHNCNTNVPLGVKGRKVSNSNKTQPVRGMTPSGPGVRRILDATRLVAHNTDNVVPKVAKATGYSEATVQTVIAKALQGEQAARQVLVTALKGGIDEANRTFWHVMGEAA